jgi:hypothetical protein
VTASAPPASAPPTFAATATPSAPSAAAIASGLDRTLKRARLWSTVGVVGDRLDVRSSSCADPGLAQIVNDARAQLVAAGVRSMRCAEVNGRIVFERGL